MKKNTYAATFIVITILFSAISKPHLVSSQTNTIDIVIDDETYGTVTQSIGLIVPNDLGSAPELISAYGGLPVYLKLQNPAVLTIQSPNFQNLNSAGFKWYFSFSQNPSATSVLDAYKNSYALANVVVELPQEDAAFILSLKSSYPGVRVHVGNLEGWRRSRVNEIIDAVQPPTLDAVSFTLLDINEGSVWDDVTFAFDTLFDASETIGGESITFPANSTISVSNAVFPPYASPQKTAYLSGIVSGTIITSVQSQGHGGEAPIRFVIPGQFSSFNAGEKILMRHFAQFMSMDPTVVWPMAIHNNGDIWDNGIFGRSDTEPIVGVIGKVSSGFYGFLTNTSAREVFVDLGSSIDFSAHRAGSTQFGSTINPSNGVFGIAAYDTVVIYPNSLPNIKPPVGNPTATSVPGAGTVIPTPTTTVINCNTQLVLGDLNCSLGVDEEDFEVWLEFNQPFLSNLRLFEYWRRAAYQ